MPIVPISTIARLISETELALEELRKVVRGVFPALLERRGLRPALAAQLDVTHPLAQLEVDDSADRRLDRAAEAAAYVFSTEVAPTDRHCVVRLRVDDGVLVVSVTGDGEPIRPGGGSTTPGMVAPPMVAPEMEASGMEAARTVSPRMAAEWRIPPGSMPAIGWRRWTGNS